MSVDTYLHSGGTLRTKSFSPYNANCVTLESEGLELTIFDLPYAKAHALAALFADEKTILHPNAGNRLSFTEAAPAAVVEIPLSGEVS